MVCKNGTLYLENFTMDYIAFGRGTENLIILPGLGDGLKTVRGMALPFSLMYRKAGSRYRVYVFSGRREMEQGHTVQDMAEDVYAAAHALNIKKSHVLGVSQGGMTAQHLAIGHPDFVEKLILTVTTDRLEEPYRTGIGNWMSMAEAGDYKGILIDTAERSYTEKYLKTARPMYGIVAAVSKPKSFTRFHIMAQACLNHDTTELLDRILCPVLILGGGIDRIVGTEAAERLASRITGAQKYIYEKFGHGTYEEAKDFQERVLAFLEKETKL